jgi:hypothetical protein
VSSAVKQGATSKATVSAVWVQLSELIKSAAERHDASNLLTLDFRRAQAHAGMRARGHAGMREGCAFPSAPRARTCRRSDRGLSLHAHLHAHRAEPSPPATARGIYPGYKPHTRRLAAYESPL